MPRKNPAMPAAAADALDIGVTAAARKHGVACSSLAEHMRKRGLVPAKAKRPSAVTLAAVETAREHGVVEAARRHGVNKKTLVSYLWRHGIPYPRRTYRQDYDLELTVLSTVAAREAPGSPMTYADIAEVCGVTKQAIHAHERTALKKLRRHPEVAHLLTHLQT